MMTSTKRWCQPVWVGLLFLIAAPVFAQQAASGKPTAHRRLAPGVLREVDPARELQESFSRHDVVELLAVDNGFDFAKDVPFRHDVWALEFKFKPVRMIWVDVPQASGQMQRKLVWYMVYSVTNTGKIMNPVKGEDNTYNVEYVDRPVRFIPSFLLEGRDSLAEEGEFNKVYPDRILPVAIGPITRREDRTRRFHGTVEISGDLPVGETKWGVVVWENVDPRIDRFSIYIQGLTNAYRWQDQPGAYSKGDPVGTGRRLLQKTLKLNFWRPGDEYYEHEREIRYGVPGKDLDYEWVYR